MQSGPRRRCAGVLPGIAQRFRDMECNLAEALGRKVDLIRAATIRNPYRLASIERDHKTVYVPPP